MFIWDFHLQLACSTTSGRLLASGHFRLRDMQFIGCWLLGRTSECHLLVCAGHELLNCVKPFNKAGLVSTGVLLRLTHSLKIDADMYLLDSHA
jgi:hypothetical protein